MSVIARVFRGVWWLIDGFRKLLHLLLLLFILGIFLATVAMVGARDGQIAVPRNAVLVLAPQGELVDQLSGNPVDRALGRIRGNPIPETRVSHLIDAVEAGKTDPRIKAVVLRLDRMGSAGLSKLQRVAQAIQDFKASGKQVFAIGDSFNRDQYYLAAQADRIFMHPMGSVLIEGYGRYLPYFKDLLDKLYVDYNVWRVGKYKSFVEPYTRNSMSDADKLASRAYLDQLWSRYQSDVTAARHLPANALQHYADKLPELLQEDGGDMGELALDYGLIDGLLQHDTMRKRIWRSIERGKAGFTDIGSVAATTTIADADAPGEVDDQPEQIPFIGSADYLHAIHATKTTPRAKGNEVAVITLVGEILDGVQPPGTIGGDSTAGLIASVAVDKQVKALVLHVDSPGGSAFAADVILHQIERFQQTGRPVVVSMDSVAASGGYWISMSADQIWANATTLTGSIGVGATLPTFQNSLAKIGIHFDGIGTTALSGGYMRTRALGDNVKNMLGQSIRNTYQQFVGQVAKYRGMSVGAVNRVAQGRVWTGKDAKERGLVDELGTLNDAIKAAAGLAGLKEGTYTVKHIEPRVTLTERLAMQLIHVATPVLENAGITSLFAPPLANSPLAGVIKTMRQSLGMLARWNDPRGMYSYCFCRVR